MKQKFPLLLFTLLVTSCSPSLKQKTYSVSFMDEEKVFYQTSVRARTKLDKPLSHPAKAHHTFDDWYVSDFLRYDFNLPVTSDLVLYASFNFDYETFVNWGTTLYSQSMTLYGLFYNEDREGTDSVTKTTSGVIFAEDDDYYYVLTTNHGVVSSLHENFEFTVRDYKGRTYDAYLVEGSKSPSYDLALVSFAKKEDIKYRLASFAAKNPDKATKLLSVSSRLGTINTTLLGEVVDYKPVKYSISEESITISFPVMLHTTPVLSGSSGSGLYDPDFKLVGIHFASSEDSTSHIAIPIEKVREYLSLYFE